MTLSEETVQQNVGRLRGNTLEPTAARRRTVSCTIEAPRTAISRPLPSPWIFSGSRRPRHPAGLRVPPAPGRLER